MRARDSRRGVMGRAVASVLTLLLGGAALGGAVLGGAALAAEPRQEAKGGRKALPALDTEPTDVLAWIGGRPITRQDLEARLDDLSPTARRQFQTAEGRRQLLDRLIEEQVWLEAAEKAGLAGRPDVARRLERTRGDLLIRTHLSEVMQDVPAPSESAIVAHYEAHKGDPEFQTREAIEARHIQVPAEDEAKQVLQRLRRGEKWDRLVSLRSQDGATKENGGRLGRIERGAGFGPLGRQTALADSAFAAPLGQPIGPLKSSVGWHVVVVDQRFAPEPLPIGSLRPQIQAQLSREGGEAFYRSQLEDAKRAAGLRWNDAAVDSFLVGRRSAAELFREAQDAATSDERIAAYRRVVEEHPENELAPQAQFMVGFIYSEEKKDYDQAESAFRELLRKYPQSELVVSANWMLENMRSDKVPEFDPNRPGFPPVESESETGRPR